MSLRYFAHPGGGVFNATPDRVVFGPGSAALKSASAFCSHARCVSSRLITYW